MDGLAGAARSPLEEALGLVGDRWTLLLVEALLGRSRRFGDLLEGLSGISPNILSERLRRLERDALVVATPYSQRPPRFVYGLTAAGEELAGVLRLLADWGARHSEAEQARHADCGAALEVRWWCPACRVAVEEDEVEAEQII